MGLRLGLGERLARGDAAEGAEGEQAASDRPGALLRAHAHLVRDRVTVTVRVRALGLG